MIPAIRVTIRIVRVGPSLPPLTAPALNPRPLTLTPNPRPLTLTPNPKPSSLTPNAQPAGVFLAGMSLSFLQSYRVKITSKIDSMHAFAQMMFLLLLGIIAPLHSTHADLTELLMWAVIIAILVVLVCPLFTVLVGYLSGFMGRTTFYLSLHLNSIGEISLLGQVRWGSWLCGRWRWGWCRRRWARK